MASFRGEKGKIYVVEGEGRASGKWGEEVWESNEGN